jgi:hypothetical protein
MVRNYKLRGNDIVNADFADADIVIGSFRDGLLEAEKKKIINDLVYGREMLEIYEECRDSLHIVDVVNALKKMEFVFTDWKHKNTEASLSLWDKRKARRDKRKCSNG